MFSISGRLIRLVTYSMALTAFFGLNTAEASSPVPGVTDHQILVGTLGPQTGPVAAYDGVRKGIQAYFDYVNHNGGVKGRQLKLIAYDDQYQPGKTVALIRRLVEEDQVFALLGNIGTPTTSAVEKYIEKKGIPLVMLASGASKFFNPPIANFMGSCVASYSLEARVMVNYAIKKLGDKNLAIAYSNDDYGVPVSRAAVEAIKTYHGVKVVQQVKFQVGDSDLSSQAQKIGQAKPDAILVFAQPSPTAHLKKALYAIGISSKNTDFMTTQEGGHEPKLFELAGKEVWNGSYSMAALPGIDSSSKGMALFVQQFHKQFPDDSPAGQPQLGWGSAQVFVEALRRTKVLTRKNFLKSFYTFHNWEGSICAGISFSEGNHSGVNTLFITQAIDGKTVPISGLISADPDSGKIIEHGSVN